MKLACPGDLGHSLLVLFLSNRLEAVSNMSQLRTLMSLETPTQGRQSAVQHRPAQAPGLSRRQLGLGVLSGLAAAATALQAAPQATAAELTP